MRTHLVNVGPMRFMYSRYRHSAACFLLRERAISNFGPFAFSFSCGAAGRTFHMGLTGTVSFFSSAFPAPGSSGRGGCLPGSSALRTSSLRPSLTNTLLSPPLPQAPARAGAVYQVVVRCGGLHTPRANIAVGGSGRELGLVLHGNLATSRWVWLMAVARLEDE